MLTPKEKAIEIVNRFRPFVYFSDGNNSMNVQFQIDENSKKCAIECVEEIQLIFAGLHKPEYTAFDAIGERKFTFQGEYPEHMTGYDMISYYNEVKQEIEKL